MKKLILISLFLILNIMLVTASINSIDTGNYIITKQTGIEKDIDVSFTKTGIGLDIRLIPTKSRSRIISSIQSKTGQSGIGNNYNIPFNNKRFIKIGSNTLIIEQDNYWNISNNIKSWYISKTGFQVSNEPYNSYANIEWQILYNKTLYNSKENIWNWTFINTSSIVNLTGISEINSDLKWVSNWVIKDDDTHIKITLSTNDTSKSYSQRFIHSSINISNDTTQDVILLNGSDFNVNGNNDINISLNKFKIIDDFKFIDNKFSLITDAILNIQKGIITLYSDLKTIIIEWTDPEITSGGNDAEECLSSGQVSTSSSDLELGEDSFNCPSTLLQIVGLRFNDINITQGHIITNAFIEFTVDTTQSINTNFTFSAEANDNSSRFFSSPFNISKRVQTNTKILSQNISTWVDATTVQTINISPIIQEIINRTGWKFGNSIVILINSSGLRRAESFEGLPSPARLIFNSTPPVNITGDNPPSIILNSPLNNTITNNTIQILQCTATDDINLVNASLFHNASGIFALNETSIVSGTSAALFFNKTFNINTSISWNCQSGDDNNQSSAFESNFVITFNETFIIPPPPIPPLIANITLINPLNISIDTDGAVTYTYNVNVTGNSSLFVESSLNPNVFVLSGTLINVIGQNSFIPIQYNQNQTLTWFINHTFNPTAKSELFVFNITKTKISPLEPVENVFDDFRKCPLSTLQSTLMFIFFFVLAFGIMSFGYVIKHGLVGWLGSALLLALSFYIYVCLIIVGIILSSLGLVLMYYFVSRGSRNFE